MCFTRNIHSYPMTLNDRTNLLVVGLFCVVDETGSIEFSGRGSGRGESSPFPRMGGILHTRVLNLLAPVATETLNNLLNAIIPIFFRVLGLPKKTAE